MKNLSGEEERRTIGKAMNNLVRLELRVGLIGLLAITLVGSGVYLFRVRPGDAQSSPHSRSSPVQQNVPVLTAKAKPGDLDVYLSGLGTVTALNTVSVKTRVDGQLDKVLFQEGQLVTAGQLLAQVDPRPSEVQLAQAEGQFAHDQASLTNAQIDLERYRVLFKEDSVPKQQLDTQESLVRQLQGTIKADQSQVDNAKLQLIYCRITAPITGRVGLRLVDAGNMVHAADVNGLVIITQLQPITVIFTLPEDNLPAVLAKVKAKQQLPVTAFDREQKKLLATGALQSIDNQIDPTTGTVKLKAVFANADDALFPNQFVNARIAVDTLRNATLVPNAAIQRSPQSTFVYTVNPDNTVAAKNVEVKLTQGDQTAVASGLAPGETVVIDGVDKLQPGTKVVARAADQTPPGPER
jgi:membrane fusion protein, multidrug efflux system